MKPLCRGVALAALLAGPAQAGLPLALEGSWYNPPQSGHGLTVERIDPEHALLFWHVFDPEGRPLTLYVEAALEGDRLVGTALAPMGMQFGSFDPDALELPVWGEVSLQFLDCNQAVLRYDAVAPGYGAGEIPLTRLLPPRTHCSLGAATDLQGLRGSTLRGEIQLPEPLQPSYGGPGRLLGAVAANGHVLAGVSARRSLVLEGLPVNAAPGRVELDWRVLDNTWSNALFGEEAERLRPVQPLLQFSAPIELNEDGSRGSGFLFTQGLDGAPDQLRLGFGPAYWREDELLPGRYVATIVDPRRPEEQGTAQPWVEILVQSDGALCLRPGPVPTGDCLMQGQATPVEGGAYDLELTALDPDEPAYRGLVRFGYYPVVIFRRYFVDLVASNGTRGLSIYGLLQEDRP